MLDGADLELSSDCKSKGASDPGCGGSTTVTMSYANAPEGLNEQPAEALIIWQFVPGAGWQNLDKFQGVLGDIMVNQTTMTVTAISPFGPGVYVLGFDTGGAGGGGGGGTFPGAGIVLDLVAPIVSGNEPPVSSSSLQCQVLSRNQLLQMWYHLLKILTTIT